MGFDHTHEAGQENHCGLIVSCQRCSHPMPEEMAWKVTAKMACRDRARVFYLCTRCMDDTEAKD